MLLLSTSSLQGYGLYRIFKFAKQAGYAGIDLALNKNNHDLWDENYVKEMSDEFGLPVLSVTAPSKGMDQKQVDKVIKIAQVLKAQLVTFTPPHYKDKKPTWFLNYLQRIKKNITISIAIQNVDSKFVFFIFPEYKNSTLSEIKKITGNTVLDLSNIDLSSGMDIMKAQKILGGTIKNIFLSDKRASKKLLLPGQAGGGTSFLPLESLLMTLKTTSYAGFITLKVKPTELGVGNEQKVIQNLEYIKEYYNKHFFNYK